ncbi:MAG TPA: hypothetical protein VKB57_22140 [Acidimicrobiales bacterium]|nr:hypothetical protein [Acidimicrobiales bacterium]
MRGRVHISVWLLIWVIVGVLVAVNKGYGGHLDTTSQIGSFVLAVLFWPVPATGGAVSMHF